MLQQTDIERVIAAQWSKIGTGDTGLPREALLSLPDLKNHALIISGIRRCGKSTLLRQLLKRHVNRALYLNFDDPRLIPFAVPDFQLLDSVIAAAGYQTLFFDEIQVISGWEFYIRQKLDEGFRVTVTGSNASLLSRELGTKLTGRHVTRELFPFSYREFLGFKNLPAGDASLRRYLDCGGFPEFLKTGDTDVLATLFHDLLNRDIAVRHNIRDTLTLKRLAVFLISNAGNLVTAGKLRQVIGIKTAATVMEYFSHLTDTYLVAFMPRFSRSLKVQSVNPRKIYAIDPGMIGAVSSSLSENRGYLLENLLYWELRRVGAELFYFHENGAECDFVVLKKNRVRQVIQVCFELTPANREREQRGLREAMDYFKTDNGVIITANQRDAYIQDKRKIQVVPAWEFIAELNPII